MFVLLGSRAAKTWFSDFREPKDWDVVADLSDITAWSKRNSSEIKTIFPKSDRKLTCKLKNGEKIEFEINSSPSTQKLFDLSADDFKICAMPFGDVALAASPNVLWLTKRSHIYWNIHWNKTIRDLHWIKERSLSPVSSDEKIYYELRLQDHSKRFGLKTAKLDMSNDAFFAKSEKSVGRKIDHDLLHESVAYESRPMFEKFKTDLSKAMLSKKLFDNATYIDQLRLVREEAMVIALERYIIPYLPNVDENTAYSKALRRICTNLTSGWFRDFAIDNWINVQYPDKEFSTEVLKLFESPLK